MRWKTGIAKRESLVAAVLEEKEFESVKPETMVALVQRFGRAGSDAEIWRGFARRAKACLNGRRDSEYGARADDASGFYSGTRELGINVRRSA